MDVFQAIIYGIVQGITEFLPISSTAHLVLLPWFAGWEDPGLEFDVALHLGTLVSLLWYFRADWYAFALSTIRTVRGQAPGAEARMVGFIAVATIPGGVIGYFGEEIVETHLRSPLVIASTLIGLALALVAAEKLGRMSKNLGDMRWIEAVLIGLAQAVAIIPGVSRSGITITAGLFVGLRREPAARFSFFLSAPLIAGAVAKQALDIMVTGPQFDELMMLGVGILAAAIVGYLAIEFLLRYLARNTTYVFVYYRIVLGIVVLLAFWSGFR